jgi:hypothetical protein
VWAIYRSNRYSDVVSVTLGDRRQPRGTSRAATGKFCPSTAGTADDADDDGLVGDDVCAQPKTNTVPTTTATAVSEARIAGSLSLMKMTAHGRAR